MFSGLRINESTVRGGSERFCMGDQIACDSGLMSEYMNKWMNGWMNEWMNEWCIYIALYCVLLYTQSALQSRGGGSLLNHHQCAASTWIMRRLPQDNCASALTSQQLQEERRESHRANQVSCIWIFAHRTIELSKPITWAKNAMWLITLEPQEIARA